MSQVAAIRRVTPLFTLWALAALLVLVALQVPPVPGVILMIFGGPLIAGLLVHVVLLGFVIDVFSGRMPRILLLVPVLAYGGYYAFYLTQGADIERVEADLRASNPGKIFDFDPARHALVVQDAYNFAAHHEVPVVYSPRSGGPNSQFAHRLLPRSQCDLPKDTEGRVQVSNISEGFGTTKFRVITNVCMLRFPEQAPDQTVTVIRHSVNADPTKDPRHVRYQVFSLAVDGSVLGSYRTASISRLPRFPFMYVGCALISSTPAWKCGADFIRSTVTVDGTPAGIDRARFDTPESIMLGLRRYDTADYANFGGFAQNEAALATIRREPERVAANAIEVLQAMIDGANPAATFAMAYSITRNPDRLAPLAEGIAARLTTLRKSVPRNAPNRRDQMVVLAAALSALPPDAFASVANAAFDAAQDDSAASEYPTLYIRAADAGVSTLKFYQTEFMDKRPARFVRALPLLAICRIGTADPEVVDEMKRRFLSDDRETFDSEYKSALFVTLRKLGETSFLQDNWKHVHRYLGNWIDPVMADEGRTNVGPNNCMSKTWTTTAPLPPAMTPSLRRDASGWSAAEP